MSLFRKIRWATSEAMLFIRAVINLPLGFLGAIAYIDQQAKKNDEPRIMTEKTTSYIALGILLWALLSYIDLKFKEHGHHKRTLDRRNIQTALLEISQQLDLSDQQKNYSLSRDGKRCSTLAKN